MNAFNLRAVVSAEMRSCRRLIRTWVFVAIALVTVSGMWLWYSLGHTFWSYVSPFAGLVGPHYIVSNLGSTIVLFFTAGIIFLAFDVRSRDVRDRIHEAIDTRPISNFELLLGRLIGVVLLLAIPAATMILVLWSLGFIAEVANFRFGATSESMSVLTFLVWDILPNLFLWGALTIFVAVIVRFRLLVVVIVGGMLFVYYSLSNRIPFFLASALSTYSGADAYPSALAPQFFSVDIFLNRTCILLFAAGLLGVVATIFPRQSSKGRNTRLLTVGSLAVVFSMSVVFGLVQVKLGEVRKVEAWAAYHAQYGSDSQTDIESISGRVEIFPGRKIELDLLLEISPSSSQTGNERLISLNPGYRIETLELNGSPVTDFGFENGLIQLTVQNGEDSPLKLRLVAGGVPDPLFAYLDSSLKWFDMDYVQAKGAFRFGTKSYIFHPQFVALMPGVSWFPASGSAYGVSNWSVRPQDFFDLDIEVSVPRNWILAGPGSRELVDQTRRTTYRFNPRNPIPELALVASVFERRSMNVHDIEFELLVSTKHTSNLKTLERVVPALKEWLVETLDTASELGIEYPYDTLSFVEVPVSMRVYGGGWRMGSVFAPPGIQMLRESGFPIARFDYPIEDQRSRSRDEREVPSNYLFRLLQTYFENDFDGGNPFLHLGTRYVGHQTMPEGRGAYAMDFLVAELANSLLTGREGYFSVQTALSEDVLAYVSNTTRNSGGGFGSSWTTFQNLNWRWRFSRNPSVWELMIESPLIDLDFEGNPIDAYHVLLLKTSEISEQVLEFGGEDKTGAFLSELISRYRGESYDEEDFLETASDVGLSLNSILGEWLRNAGLPGFIAAEPRIERLADTNEGERLFQTSFVLRNDESTPGVIGVSYVDETNPFGHKLESVRIEGMTSLRIAFQSNLPPTRVILEPNLSHNRDTFQLDFPQRDSYEALDAPNLPYTTEINWETHDSNVIVIDDLDEGFSAKVDLGESKTTAFESLLQERLAFVFGLGLDSTPLQFDRGIPTLSHALENLSNDPFSSEKWYRASDPKSYGKYRHTHAINFIGSEFSQAKFATNMPISGMWKLEFHVPASVKHGEYIATYSLSPGSTTSWYWSISLANLDIAIAAGGNHTLVDFDMENSLEGWNDLGVHHVETGTTEVVLSATTGGTIFGDAVKWSLVED